jgi:hypothetical protein
MPLFKWLLGGTAGGAIGAVIWILASHFLHAEIGYVAIAIGILSGLGVRMASRYDDVPPTTFQSVVAAGIAVAMILGAKFIVVSLAVDQFLAQQQDLGPRELLTGRVDDDENLAAEIQKIAAERRRRFAESLSDVEVTIDELPLRMARDEAERRETAGEDLTWPEGSNLQSVESAEDLPPEIMDWAYEKFAAMSQAEKEAEAQRQSDQINNLIAALRKMAEQPSEEDATEDTADNAAENAADNAIEDAADNAIEDVAEDAAGIADNGLAEPRAVPNPQLRPDPATVSKMKLRAYFDAFTFFDLVWLGMAMASAYRISGDDESNVPPELDSK